MKYHRHVWLSGLCGLALVAGAARADEPATSEPRPGLTRTEAEMAFGRAMILSCLGALEAGRPIADLPEAMRDDLRPATPEERKMSRG